ncbi:ABC transporter ATP-binding protein [Camelimonas abortus]|uniref:ABC transporter ATP-binding protein n=1 Tax=Camelimonas abortus TaxID=1017184 RepID=A0ABV7LBX1_9HYPH
MQPILSIRNLSKTYRGGFAALHPLDLDIMPGEIFALLGPNGAGKTTLISIICGLATPTTGTVTVGGHDSRRDFRKARAMIGLVPQELATESFETVWNTVTFTRGLFGRPRDPALVGRILRDLSLWDRKDSRMLTLSGGMKRRVMIAKAMSHEPRILFLDEPTAGVDVDLRRDMWRLVRRLKEAGVTIILTTHYIEEAEEMADRVGVINRGRLMLVEDKATLMRRMGRKEVTVTLAQPLGALPAGLARRGAALSDDGRELRWTHGAGDDPGAMSAMLAEMSAAGLAIADIDTRRSSLEDIFVDLLRGRQ